MITTSQEFIDAMRAKTVTTSARVDVIDNKYNSGIMNEKGNYGIFEGNGFELDGRISVISSLNVNDNTPYFYISSEEQVKEGWYSNDLSDSNGNISTNAYTALLRHNKKEKSNLHILFSNVRNEYAIDFSVSINGVVTNFTGNTENEIVIPNVTSYSTIIINITKWSKPWSRAKLLNVYLGTVFQYEDKDIVSINCTKGVDLLDEEIESKQVELILVDEDNTYNIFDETSELASLDNDARIIINIGVLIGNFIYYVKTDECYFKEINKTDNELEINITGMGILSKFNSIAWEKLFSEVSLYKWTLLQIKNKIFTKYPTLSDRFLIDSKIETEAQTMLLCYEKSQKANEFLNNLAINCRANLIETYDNNIVYRRISEGAPVSQIKIENMELYPDIKKKDNKYDIVVYQYNYTESEDVEEVFYGKFALRQYATRMGDVELYPYKSVELLKPNIMESSIGDYEFNLNIYNRDGTIYASNITEVGTYSFDFLTVTNKIYFSAWDDLADKTFELTFKCKTLQFSNSEYVIENYSSNENSKIISVRSIQDNETASSIANWINSNLNKKYQIKLKINDACTYELGDTVTIETGVYLDNEMIIKNGVITGIEYKYDGTLDYYITVEVA